MSKSVLKTISAWAGCLALLCSASAQDGSAELRINERPASVYRSAGDNNHAMQVVGDSIEVLWIGRDRQPFPFFGEADLLTGKVKRVVKLTETKGRSKGQRMNPSLGRYRGRTWAAWMEKIRKQRRSHFLLNLLPVESLGQAAGLQQEDAVNGSESGADAEAAADGEASDQRQIFDLGGFPSSVSFHETAHGFFALTYSQDQADKFRLRLLRLGPDEKWEQVEQASALQGLRPVLVEEGELLWLYYLQTADLISRSFSRDGIHWSPPETIGEGVAVSVDAVVLSEGTAVAWSLSTGDETRVDLARCTPQGCSEPRTIFAAEGRMGYIALASEPASGKLLLLCSYWDPKNQSQVIEASAEAQGFEKRRLTPEGKDISASSDLLVYHGRDAAFAIWHQSLGKGSQQTAGKVGLALYDYEESRWMMPPLTIGPDDATLGVADSPRLAFHGDSVWLSFIACDSRTGLFGVKTPAFTGELFLKRLDLESEEQEGQSR